MITGDRQYEGEGNERLYKREGFLQRTLSID